MVKVILFKFARSVLQLILLAIALAIIYPHGQQIWYNHDVGWFRAFWDEWRIAWRPMLIAVCIALVVVALEIIVIWGEVKDTKKETLKQDERWSYIKRLLDAIARKLGVDIDEHL